MATLTIRKADGSQAGTLELQDAVFAVDANVHCVRALVNQFMANQRSGTHSTKTRAFVSGGGRKPWRQKGTGRARQGSIRATQWRGGAIAFGPQPRDYTMQINKKVRQAAYRSIWSDLVREGRLVVIDSFGLEAPKTRHLVEVLDKLGVEAGSVLLVTTATDLAMAKSARNLPWATPINTENLNVYDLLTHDWVVVTADALKRVEANYA